MVTGPYAARRRLALTFSVSYGCLTALCLGAIYWLSSRSPHQVNSGEAVHAGLIWNVAHLPIYAALAFCWLKTFMTEPPTALAIGVAFLASAASALADEWHQSFVSGRNASMGDVGMDLTGIAAMLFILYCKGRLGGARVPDRDRRAVVNLGGWRP